MGITSNAQQSTWQAEKMRLTRYSFGLFAIPLLLMIAFVVFRPIQVLPRISLAPGFSFIDQNGKRFISEDLRGRLAIYNFTYTGCTTPCPQTSQAMRTIQEELAPLDTYGLPVEFVTISFDPAHDTPEQLHAYAESLGANTTNWHFVTGDVAQLKNVIGGGFSAYFGPGDNEAFIFDPVFAMVDGWGILRALYRTAAPDPSLVKRDVQLIAQEVKNSKGVNHYAYEAAHLFLCYPR